MGSDDQADDMERYRRAVEVALDQLDLAIGYLHGIRKEVRSHDGLGQSAVDPVEPAHSSAEAGVRLDRRRWSSAARGVAVAAKKGSETESGGRVAERRKDATKDSAKDAAQTLTPEMKKVAREAAIVVLTLVGKRAATGLTKQLATKWPAMYKEFIEPRVEGAGGINELAKRVTEPKGLKGIAVGMAAESVMDKFTGGNSSGRKADNTGRGRRRPARKVPAATNSSVEKASRPARQTSAQSSGTTKRTAKKAAPTRKAPSGTTKKTSAPPASVPPTPAKSASSTGKTTGRRTSR